jgi:hypothetical protein
MFTHPVTHDKYTGQTTIHAQCVFCDTKSLLKVRTETYNRWLNGLLVQYAFPGLTDDTREFFFVSGVCPPCFDNVTTDPKED